MFLSRCQYRPTNLSIRAGEDKAATHDWEVQLLLTLDGTDRSGGLRQFRSQQRVVCRVRESDALTSEPVISVWRVASAVWRSASAPVFEEITRAVGLDQMTILDNWDLPVEQREEYRFQVAVEDFNRDGCLDIAVAKQVRDVQQDGRLPCSCCDDCLLCVSRHRLRDRKLQTHVTGRLRVPVAGRPRRVAGSAGTIN